nr:ribonuclease H-like domain-containing protein [Tanacetum cinerariifolium]
VAKEKLKEARTHQKSYADKHRRSIQFQPGDRVVLKVSPARGVRRFGIKGKLSPHFIGPFEILDRLGEVSYRLALPPQLSHVHNVFHVSLLRGYKYHPLHVISYPLDQIRVDLSYVEEPEAILDRQVASESHKKPRNLTRKLYERVSKTGSWWYPKFTPPGYIWKPKSKQENVNPNLIEIVLFIVDSGCSKHMTGNLKLLINTVEKFLGTVKFGSDQIAPILGYGDLVQGAGNDLLTGSRGTDLYLITLQDTNSPNLICLMAKATSSQAWLWHHRLSHLNFDTINLLSKNDIMLGLPKLKFIKDHLYKRKSFHSKLTPSSKRRLHLLHMDLCGPMRVASINGKRCMLVIIDDYSRYTWTHFLRSKDETPEVLIDFLRLVQRGLQAQVKVVVSKSSDVSATNAPNERQKITTPLNIHTTPAPTCQTPTIAPTVISSENISQAEPHAENDQVADDEFINIFSTPVQDQGRRRYVMLIRQICTLSINVIHLNTVGQKIIH